MLRTTKLIIYPLKIVLSIKGALSSIMMIKDGLSGLRQFLLRPIKMMENAFYFTLKVLFVLKIFKYFS